MANIQFYMWVTPHFQLNLKPKMVNRLLQLQKGKNWRTWMLHVWRLKELKASLLICISIFLKKLFLMWWVKMMFICLDILSQTTQWTIKCLEVIWKTMRRKKMRLVTKKTFKISRKKFSKSLEEIKKRIVMLRDLILKI